MHTPKRETFDVPARTNTDPKGIVRAVDVFTLRAWGLYMARQTPGRAQFHYLESWLLPEFGLRVSVFHWNPGHEREQDFYLDVCDIQTDGDTWHTEDHYLDLVVHTGDRTDLLDVDELLDALHAGLISPETAERAIHRAVHAVDELAAHGHDLQTWLSGNGMDLSWR